MQYRENSRRARVREYLVHGRGEREKEKEREREKAVGAGRTGRDSSFAKKSYRECLAFDIPKQSFLFGYQKPVFQYNEVLFPLPSD
jgi:hypothetical protein